MSYEPNKRFKNVYELIGAVKSLSGPQYAKHHRAIKQEVLINMLTTFINDSNLTAEIFRGGFVGLSQDLKRSINQE